MRHSNRPRLLSTTRRQKVYTMRLRLTRLPLLQLHLVAHWYRARARLKTEIYSTQMLLLLVQRDRQIDWNVHSKPLKVHYLGITTNTYTTLHCLSLSLSLSLPIFSPSRSSLFYCRGNFWVNSVKFARRTTTTTIGVAHRIELHQINSRANLICSLSELLG